MSDDIPVRIVGKLLQAWEAGASAPPGSLGRQMHCGGALLSVTRDEAHAMLQGGVSFEPHPRQLPAEGRESIRVRCSDDVVTKNGYAYALCSRCAGYEMAMRHRRKQELDANKGQRRPGASRGSYDE